LISRNNNDVSFLQVESGCALGAIENPHVITEKIVIKHGDLFLLYTDGVTEAFNKNDELFSDERLENEFISIANLPAEQVVSEILEKVLLFSDGAPQSDDITILALRYK